MPLVWVTGNSGTGKSTAQGMLEARGELAVDSDWDGYSHWVDRVNGEPVLDPPYPVPPGWLDRFAWRISRSKIEQLKALAGERTAYLCGSAENESEVVDLFDLVICLVADDDTLRERLRARTGNAFGQNPEELAAVLDGNQRYETGYRRRGAVIVDGTRPAAEITDAIIASASRFAR